jgi:hypothetical protein
MLGGLSFWKEGQGLVVSSNYFGVLVEPALGFRARSLERITTTHRDFADVLSCVQASTVLLPARCRRMVVMYVPQKAVVV